METNATLIDADLARHLKEETNVYFISVSIDGPDAEVHDAFRGVKGAFDDAVRGFRHLVDAGYKPQLIMSLHRGNVEYVEEVVELAVSLGAGSVKFNPVTPTGRGVAMHERGDALGFEEVMELAHRVRGEIQKGSPTALIFETPLALYAVGELIQREKLGVCHVLNILGILGSGDMALCGIGRTIPELCYGSLRETGVREVWLHHPTLQELRDEVNGEYPAPCGSCLHVHRCQTFCVAQNYQRSGKLTSPDWLCAEAYRQGVFPVSRLKGTS
jgi:SynChlorMet cassette radical SAM/SPASM protein ScmF